MARNDARTDEAQTEADTSKPSGYRYTREARAVTESARKDPAKFYPHHEPGNWCDERGAAALKEKIAARWAGFDIAFALIPAGFTPQMRVARVDLRSDMVNGMPRGLFKLRAAK